MENRKRNIQMKFYVTEEEKRLIDEKMKQLPIKQYGAYFRKMAIDGYIVFVKRKCEQKGPKKVSTFSTRFHVVSNVFPKYQMLTF